jgi:hypothetical protein
MSKRKRPKRLFRQRRGESAESAQFRLEMRRADDAEYDKLWRTVGVDPDAANLDELFRLSECCGIFPLLDLPGQPLTALIRPRRDYGDYSEFDRAIVAAGLPRFVRPWMDSDVPSGDLPADLIAEFQQAEFIVVLALGPGIRVRRGCYFKSQEADS